MHQMTECPPDKIPNENTIFETHEIPVRSEFPFVLNLSEDSPRNQELDPLTCTLKILLSRMALSMGSVH